MPKNKSGVFMMMKEKIISNILVKSGAYKDLESPVILASGELGIYFVNTQFVLGDRDVDKRVDEFGDDSAALIGYAERRRSEDHDFNKLVHLIAYDVRELFDRSDKEPAVSGGQRRDWIFSGPVAKVLGVPHVSVYKDGRIELVDENDGKADRIDDLRGIDCVHVVDLLTRGSSVYRVKDDVQYGWAPFVRSAGGRLDHLRGVVSRKQGGESMLGFYGIDAKCYVNVDGDFLRQYSKHPDVAVAYFSDPHGWSVDYIKKNGVDFLVPFFDPEKVKNDKVFAFLGENMHGKTLRDAGLMDDLCSKVERAYGKPLDSIVGGK